MGSFEINSAELGTIISQYQRIGRDLSNYSGRIRREVQRLNSQKGFGIETVRSNLTHLSSNSNAHSRDAYIFGGFLKDLETESTNAESQVSKGMYNAAPTKMSLTQLVAGALAILVGFVFSKPLIAPIAAWLAALIKNAPGCKFPEGLPTPGLTPKPAFPPVSEPIVCGNGIGITGEPVLIPPITGGDPSTIGGVIGGAAVGGAVAGGMAGGATGVAEEPATPEIPQVSEQEPADEQPTGTGDINAGGETTSGYQLDENGHVTIDRNSDFYNENNRFTETVKTEGEQCTWFAYGRAQELTGKQPQFSGEGGLHGRTWGDRITNGTNTLKGSYEEPSIGTIMVWNERAGNGYGHVAVIEKVIPFTNSEGKPDYKIIFSEANWNHYGKAGDRTAIRETTLSALKGDNRFESFIDLD